MKKIIIDDIEIKITRKQVKNINLSVHPPEGHVRVSAPYGVADETIGQFLLSKIKWIKKNQKRCKNQRKRPKLEYIEGENHYFLGHGYQLNIIYISKNPAQVKLRDDVSIDLYVKKDASKQAKEKLLKEWYRQQLKKLIPPLIKKWEPVIDVKVTEFGVKQMKTRWGTCNTRAKRIWINLELAKKSPHFLEYIVVHEMVHLREASHNHRFKAYMDEFLPDWPQIQEELNAEDIL